MLTIDIHLNGNNCWPDLAQKGYLAGRLTSIARLDNGAAAGVTLRIDLPDGQAILTQISLALLGQVYLAFLAEEIRAAGLHRIYFDIADLAAFQAWLNDRPAGVWHVLVGGDDPPDTILSRAFTAASALGPDLVAWLANRITDGQIVFHSSQKLDLPSGEALS